MHRKLQHLQPALVSRKGPILLQDNTRLYITQPLLQMLNELGYKVLPHLPYSPDLSPTSDHFFKYLDNSLQGKCFHNQKKAENACQELFKSGSMDFYAIGIHQLISHWQNMLIVMVPILINNDVFEPTYKDLKFIIWNCDYICTNLIAYLLYLFICWLTFELFPCLGYCK